MWNVCLGNMVWGLHQIDGKFVYVAFVNIINVSYSALFIYVDNMTMADVYLHSC